MFGFITRSVSYVSDAVVDAAKVASKAVKAAGVKVAAAAVALACVIVPVASAHAEGEFVVPTQLNPSTMMTSVLSIIGPVILTVVGLGAAFTAFIAVYRVISRKFVKFGRSA